MITTSISKENDPLDNAREVVQGAFIASKGQPDEVRIERIMYAIAAIFRDVPIESDGLPMLLIKMNPDKSGSVCKVHGDIKELSAMISKHIDTPQVLKPILLALACSKNIKVVSI